jgi:chaperonin GroES
MKIRPLGNRVLLRPIEVEEKTKSGIYIPESAKEKPLQAEVIAVGPGEIDENGKRKAMDVKVGDKVIFESFGGSEIKIESVKHILMDVKDILAVVEGRD